MSGKSEKGKDGASGLAKMYLIGYNISMTVGWSYVLCLLTRFYFTNDFKDQTLWNTVYNSLMIFQNGAIFEIFHAIFGLVKSNPVVTTFQVLSRVMVVCGVLLATPTSVAAASVGLPIALLAWSVTEIIRYGYYFANLIHFVPRFLVWLRYTTFIALYPIGVTGELLCFYAAQKFAASNPSLWSYALPNTWNFTFSYHYLLLAVMFLYLPLFPQLYLHMFAQRRKILGPSNKSQKVH